MAAKNTGLRAVAPDEKPAQPAKKLDVATAAESGDHRALLVAIRDRIARAVTNQDCPPRDLAALTKRLQDIAKEIEGIDLRDDEEHEEPAHVSGDDDQAFDPASAI